MDPWKNYLQWCLEHRKKIYVWSKLFYIPAWFWEIRKWTLSLIWQTYITTFIKWLYRTKKCNKISFKYYEIHYQQLLDYEWLQVKLEELLAAENKEDFQTLTDAFKEWFYAGVTQIKVASEYRKKMTKMVVKHFAYEMYGEIKSS